MKSQIHIIKEKVQVIVFRRKAEVLFLKTRPERLGGFWQNITGSVEKGETFLEAAKRELEEETGILAIKEELIEIPYQVKFIDKKKREVIEKVFYHNTVKDDEIILDPKEHEQYQWKILKEVREDSYKFPSNYHAFNSCLQHMSAQQS